MHLRVFNYNTCEKIKEWEAHTDYIRYLEIHPNRPFVISSSDDMSIKLWDWERDFECIQIFEGHVHYVMMIKINPRDTNIFASASLDRTIKVWGLTAGTSHFSLDAHERGVNCIDYYPGGDKPYLLSGADDRTIKIWDYQTKACLQTLEGHTHNVSAVCFHPRLPLIVSASEDGTVRLWHSTTYRPESTLNYGLERAWTLAPTKDANKVAIGYDEGTIVIKLGNERPVASLDTNTGKLVWAASHDIQTISLKGLNKEGDLKDGERIPLNPRDLGSCEVYPQNLIHNCNGQFVVVCGDGEYIIYTSQALRNKSFGSALDFVWSSKGTGDYAIRESISRVRTFKNFKDHKQIPLPMSSADGIFGGACLGVSGPECILFFDWDEGDFVRKIDVSPTQVFWNEAGDALALVCTDSYYILKFDGEKVINSLAAGNVDPEEGIDGSFELETSINDVVTTGQWVGECFLYTNASGRLNYYVGGEVMTLCHLEQPMYLLGYTPKEDRVFLIDRMFNVCSYRLLLSVLNYQTAVVRNDFDSANLILPSIPRSECAQVARFLESQGYKEEALQVTTDPDHKFELAIDLRNMEIAHEVLKETDTGDDDSTDLQSKWRRLGDLALSNGYIELAENCAVRSNDLSGLLLLYSASANKDGMKKLAIQAKESGRSNVSFLAYFITGQVEKCIELLIETGRIPEASFFARTYMPSQISRVLEMWKSDLKQINEKAAEALADPSKYGNLFPDLEWAMVVEDMFKNRRDVFVPASSYPNAKSELNLNLVELVKAQAQAQAQALENPVEDMTNKINEIEISQENYEEVVVHEDQFIEEEEEVILQIEEKEIEVDQEIELEEEVDLDDLEIVEGLDEDLQLDEDDEMLMTSDPQPDISIDQEEDEISLDNVEEGEIDLNDDNEEEDW
jgi:coatomer subunit beta'